MLAEIYIQALLVDEEAADQFWEVWNAGAIKDEVAACAWWLIAFCPLHTPMPPRGW